MTRRPNSISFIVPVLNREQLIGACLSHISQEMEAQDELFVVDNGSSDATVDIASRLPRVRLIGMPGVTIAALRNAGAMQSRGDLLAFVDSDCIVCAGWRGNVERIMQDLSISATGSLYDIPYDSTWIERAWFSSKLLRPRPVHYIPSGNLIVRRHAFDSVTGFDAKMITDEDSDFGARLNAAGFVMLEDPQVRVIHLGNPKSLVQFYRKKRWHATGGTRIRTATGLDKSVAMTYLFVVSLAVAALQVPVVMLKVLPWWIVPSLPLSIPLLTALYRVLQSRRARYFLPLSILYLVFYIARSHSLIQHCFRTALKGTR